MAISGKNLKKIYEFFKEAEPLREAGLSQPSARSRMTKEIIASTARQNAAIAAAFFVPGSDMPVLTLNQMKMIIKIAALYGHSLSVERVKELLVTMGSGYLFRGMARQLVGVFPGLGLAVKASVAYGGTQTLGKLAQKYFEQNLVLKNKTTN